MFRFALFLLVFLAGSATALAATAPLPGTSVNAPAAIAPLKKEEEKKAPDNPFSVSGIKVDASAESSMKARDKAFTSGQRDAFMELAKRLSGGASFDIKDLKDHELANTVRSFEVETERASGTRYVATLTYHFRQDNVTALLQKHGITVNTDPTGTPDGSVVVGGRTLVLPILRNNGRDILFEEKTTWLRAWENYFSDTPAPEFVLPEGGIDDLAAISAGDALAGVPPALIRIMQKYQAKIMLVASLISPSADPSPSQTLSIQLARFDEAGTMQGTAALSLYGEPQRRSAEWLQDGVKMAIASSKDIASKYASGISTPSLPTHTAPAYAGPALQVRVSVPFLSMEEWAGKRSVLENIPGMTQLEVLRVNRLRALINMSYAGAQANLDAALAARGFRVTPSPENDGSFLLVNISQPPATMPMQPVFRTVYPQPAATQPAQPPVPEEETSWE